MLPEVQLGQGCRMRGTGEYVDGGVGFEEQEKTWTVLWGSNPQERQRGLGTSPILSIDVEQQQVKIDVEQ